MQGDDAPGWDPLSRFQAGLHLRCSLGGGLTLTAPWSLRSRGDLPAGFYVISSGRCWFRAAPLPSAVRLGPGDILYVAPNLEHVLSNTQPSGNGHKGRSLRPVASERSRNTVYGGGGAATRVIRGSIQFPGEMSGPLLSSLPAAVHLRGGGGTQPPWLAAAFAALIEARRGPSHGVQRMADLLAEALLARLMREQMQVAATPAGHPLAALADPIVGPVLEAMRARSGEPWTVAALAREAGLSRSLFAARFLALVGMPPIHYLQECRMQAASTLLRDGRGGLKEIARQAGYASEPAFSGAFKRWSGRPPGVFRKEAVSLSGDRSSTDGRTLETRGVGSSLRVHPAAQRELQDQGQRRRRVGGVARG